MDRRCLLALAGPALVVVAGCGPVVRSAWKVERAAQRVETALTPNRVDDMVYQPSHRVALATLEALRAELAEVKVRRVELTRDRHYDTPEGKPPAPGTVAIPGDAAVCWLDGLPDAAGPALVNCQLVAFAGKTKDGQKVDATVRLEVVGSDQRTVVSVQVGGRGDATGSRSLMDRIAAQLRSPATRPGSPEERAALRAAFIPASKGNVADSAASGEITITMD